MKLQNFLLFITLPLLILSETTNITGIESPIPIKKGTHHYEVDFSEEKAHSTYYIATEGKDKGDVELYLGGDCLEKCSNLVSVPSKEANCEAVNKFLGKYQIIKLFPNQACQLYFTIETTEEITLLVHHQPTIQVSEIQTIPLMFAIPSAPVFLEYIPKFPATFVSQAKIYVNPAEKEDIGEVYFGKDADHQDCNTHYPDAQKHCFTFKLPSYTSPNSYFIAFSYVTTITSNLYIGIYPSDPKIKDTKVTIGYSMPFIAQGIECPKYSQLIKLNEDTYCKQCSENCEECKGEKCVKCLEGAALFEGKCVKHECDNLSMYKNTEGECVECKKNCKYCKGDKCLKCNEEFVLVEGECEEKAKCKKSEYYNISGNKCEECMTGCESCIEANWCEKCEGGFYYSEVELKCIPLPTCKSNQYLSENHEDCLNCQDKCTKCKSATECIECEEGFTIKNGQVVKDCGTGKFFNEESKQCEQCMKNCKQCSDNEKCESCKGGYYLTDAKSCKESPLCKPGQYLAPKRDECLSCPSDCTCCKNSTYCQNCKKGYSLVGHQLCAPTCSKFNFYSISEQKCSSCIENCESCMDDQSCQKCGSGFKYHLKEGKCLQTLNARVQSAFGLAVGVLALLFMLIL